jgi:sulfate transport system permease protein
MKRRMLLYSIVYLWFIVLIALPVGGIVVGAFSGGIGVFARELIKPEAVFSLQLTLLISSITVVVNTCFGTLTALVIARRSSVLWRWINAIVDVPFAVSPVIAGLALVLVYGPNAWIGGLLQQHGIKIIFAIPGMVLATLFVTFPFVVRELVPVLREVGIAQEEASFTLGASHWTTFWRVTLPSIRGSMIYGMVLTLGRSLGEFGAVIVVSGSIIMVTQSATQYAYQATINNDMQAAYSVSIVLAMVSIVVLLLLQLTKKRVEAKRS